MSWGACYSGRMSLLASLDIREWYSYYRSEDTNSNAADTLYNQTPLYWAEDGRHEGIVKLLLKREDLNPDIQGFSDESDTWFSMARGHRGIVKIFSKPESSPPTTIYTKIV